MDKEKLLVISSYPRKGEVHGKHTVGVASYTKNTLLALSKHYKNLSITVLAEKLESESSYSARKINVTRIWERNSFLIFLNLLKEIARNHKDTKNILIEFEVAMFGDMMYVFPLPIFIAILRLMGKRITLVSHQVIRDINELSGHINIKNEGTAALGINVLIKLFYSVTLPLCNRVVVFDEVLKDHLANFTDRKKIAVIPHGIENVKKPNKFEALRKLRLKTNQFVVLAFGFIAWYKGTDLLVHAFRKYIRGRKRNRHYKLIIAGGPNPNHMNKDYYTRYLKSILNESRSHGIRVTGFIPEKEIGNYYQSSDAIVFPYRTFMSASGPLAIAFSYQKPVLLSDNLKDLFKTRDMLEALTESNLLAKDFLFEDGNDLRKKLMRIEKNKTLAKKLVTFAKYISKKRSFENIANMYYEEIFN